MLELNEREENIHLNPIHPFVSTAPHVAKLESVHHFILSHNKMDLNSLAKGGVEVIKAVKILALPRRGRGGGLTPAKIFFGGFVTVHRG